MLALVLVPVFVLMLSAVGELELGLELGSSGVVRLSASFFFVSVRLQFGKYLISNQLLF